MLDGLTRADVHYRGVLYIGLMLTSAGPKVLEFNCLFGDPETQAILLRLRGDLLDVLDAAVDGRLADANLRWDPRPALCVVMAAAGYPDKPQVGVPITALPADTDDLVVFHAGTQRDGDRVVTAGGRVLGVTALGDTLADARRKAYAAVERIHFEGAQYRTDLGQ